MSAALLKLADEAHITPQAAPQIIDRITDTANQFSTIADDLLPQRIRCSTLTMIQRRIRQNIEALAVLAQ